MRLRVDMLARGLGDGSLEVDSAEFTDTTGNYTLFDDVRIEDAILLKVVRNRILCEEWSLQADFSADPLAFPMGLVRSMFARATRSKLRSECSTLDLVELLKALPRFAAARTSDINFESYNRHSNSTYHGGTQPREIGALDVY
jgi:hypothetical protein